MHQSKDIRTFFTKRVAIEDEGKPVNSMTSLSKLIVFQGLLMVNFQVLVPNLMFHQYLRIPVSMTMTQPDASPVPVPVRVMLTMTSSSDEPHSVLLEPAPFKNIGNSSTHNFSKYILAWKQL